MPVTATATALSSKLNSEASMPFQNGGVVISPGTLELPCEQERLDLWRERAESLGSIYQATCILSEHSELSGEQERLELLRDQAMFLNAPYAIACVLSEFDGRSN